MALKTTMMMVLPTKTFNDSVIYSTSHSSSRNIIPSFFPIGEKPKRNETCPIHQTNKLQDTYYVS